RPSHLYRSHSFLYTARPAPSLSPPSLHDALPICRCLACNTCVDEMRGGAQMRCVVNGTAGQEVRFGKASPPVNERIAVIGAGPADRKSTRLNSSHDQISYAVFCLEKKNRQDDHHE